MRTDIHRPSAINPQDYEYVAPEMARPGEWEATKVWRDIIHQHMTATGGTYSRHAHGGNCGVCGNANAIYTILFYHRPSNTYIRMGETCATNVDASFDNREFRRFINAVGQERYYKTGKSKAERVLAERELSRAWELWNLVSNNGLFSSEIHSTIHDSAIGQLGTLKDIVDKLIVYGDLSDKQFSFLATLVERIDNAEKIAVARQAEHDAAEDAPITDERITIVGEILSAKIKDTGYGPQLKLLIKTKAGWKCYGTSTKNINPKVGDIVQFAARLTVSNDDKKFAFFSRPTKAKIKNNKKMK